MRSLVDVIYLLAVLFVADYVIVRWVFIGGKMVRSAWAAAKAEIGRAE